MGKKGVKGSNKQTKKLNIKKPKNVFKISSNAKKTKGKKTKEVPQVLKKVIFCIPNDFWI
jgi:hypothetical protein